MLSTHKHAIESNHSNTAMWYEGIQNTTANAPSSAVNNKWTKHPFSIVCLEACQTPQVFSSKRRLEISLTLSRRSLQACKGLSLSELHACFITVACFYLAHSLKRFIYCNESSKSSQCNASLIFSPIYNPAKANLNWSSQVLTCSQLFIILKQKEIKWITLFHLVNVFLMQRFHFFLHFY